jgi:hypothetical protein
MKKLSKSVFRIRLHLHFEMDAAIYNPREITAEQKMILDDLFLYKWILLVIRWPIYYCTTHYHFRKCMVSISYLVWWRKMLINLFDCMVLVHLVGFVLAIVHQLHKLCFMFQQCNC